LQQKFFFLPSSIFDKFFFVNLLFIFIIFILSFLPTTTTNKKAEQRRLPPYRIENLSFETLLYHQEDVPRIEEVLLPYQTDRYTWDDLLVGGVSGIRRLVITAVGTDNQPHDPIVLGAFSLDRICEHPTENIGDGKLPLRVSVVAHGPTKIIRIVDTRIRSGAGRHRGGRSGSGGGGGGRGQGQGHGHGQGHDSSTTSIATASSRGRRRGIGWMETLSPWWWWSSSSASLSRNSTSPQQTTTTREDTREDAIELLRVQLSKSWWSTSLASHFLAERGGSDSSSLNDLQVEVDVRGIGISLVDATPRELIYCALSGLRVRVEHTTSEAKSSEDRDSGVRGSGSGGTTELHAGIQIGSLQIDNQLHTTLYPVLLHTDRNATHGALLMPGSLAPTFSSVAMPEGPQASLDTRRGERLTPIKSVRGGGSGGGSGRAAGGLLPTKSGSGVGWEMSEEESGEEDELEKPFDNDEREELDKELDEEDEEGVENNDDDEYRTDKNHVEQDRKKAKRQQIRRRRIRRRRRRTMQEEEASRRRGASFPDSSTQQQLRPVFEIALLSNSELGDEVGGFNGGGGAFTNVRYFSVLVLPLHANVDGNLVTAFLQMSSRLVRHREDEEERRRSGGGSSGGGGSGGSGGNGSGSSSGSSGSGGHRRGEGDDVLITVPGRVFGMSSSQSRLQAVLGARKSGPKVYFEEVEIHPLRITVSFVADGSDGGHATRASRGGEAPLNSILRSMGARLTMIINAPLQLNGVALSDAYVTVGTLSDRIVTRYRGDAIRQA